MDTLDGFKTTLGTLKQQLATDTEYFRNVYNYTFEFSRPPGQRSLGASPLLLLLSGSAYAHCVHSYG